MREGVASNSVKFGVRLIAALLIVGGAAGIAVVLWTEAAAYTLPHLLFLALAMLLFCSSVWVGIDLWRGKPKSYKWAQLLFVLQIPNIGFHGFAYQFYVGLVLDLSFSREAASNLNLEFEVASRLNFQVWPEMSNLIFGVNLIAITALIYLIMTARRRITLDANANPSDLHRA
jgi:hypothetical protein